MHCNITHVRRKGAELVQTKSEALDVEHITIGSDKNQDIFLDDVYVISQHAEIILHKKKFFIVAVDGESTGGISVNSQLVQTKELKKDDVLNFGDFAVTVLELDAKQAELQLQIEKKTDGVPATRFLASRSSLRLEDTWLIRKRNWSVKVFTLIFALFMLIPLVGYFMPAGINEKLRDTPVVPSDNSWETGDLAHAHHIDRIGNNCNKCHQKPFVMVEDSSCSNSGCHQKMQAHIDPKLYTEHGLKKHRCGSCHKEHNGDDNDLIDSNDKLCYSCHHAVTEEGTYDKNQELENVIDLETHPEFHISLHKLDGNNKEFNVKRYSLEKMTELEQKSNLKFPHDKHLVYKGIENKTTGEKNVKLECETCHESSVAETGFKPVTRKDHCADCHLLTFEPGYENDIDRQVPHGDVAEVLYYLNGYYSKRVLKGVKEEPAPTEKQETTTGRFRPGADSNTDDSDVRVDNPDPQDRTNTNQWVDEQVKIASDEIFNKTSCVVCHEVIEKKDATPAWDILPVRINQRWFPKAEAFNHKKHSFESCTSCHNKHDGTIAKENGSVIKHDHNHHADKTTEQLQNECKEAKEKEGTSKNILKECTQLASSTSADILMPKLEKCQECHSSGDVANKSKTACVTCHGFHTDKNHFMGYAKDKEDQ